MCNSRGFSSIEALLAATVFGLLVTSLIGVLVYSQNTLSYHGRYIYGGERGEAALESVRNMRDNSFSNLTAGVHGIQSTSNGWSFVGANDNSGSYTRSTTVSNIDAHRKKVSVEVSWPKQTSGSSSKINLTTHFTNWRSYIKNWANALLGGSYDVAGTGNAMKVAVSGDYAYLIKTSSLLEPNNLYVINISNPSVPTLVSAMTLNGTPQGIAVSGNYAYIASSDITRDLQIINVSNPGAPTLAGVYDAPGLTSYGISVSVSGSTVILGKNEDALADEMLLVNVSNPALPSLIGSYNSGATTYDLYRDGNYVYAATGADNSEVKVVNIATPSSPVIAANVNLPSSDDALTVHGYGTLVFVGQGANVHSLDVTTPTAPVMAGSIASSGGGVVNDLAVESTMYTYIFIATSSATAEFQAINIDNPASMVVSRTVDVAGSDSPLTGNSSAINGIVYDANKRIAIAASSSDTQELMVFLRN